MNGQRTRSDTTFDCGFFGCNNTNSSTMNIQTVLGTWPSLDVPPPMINNVSAASSGSSVDIDTFPLYIGFGIVTPIIATLGLIGNAATAYVLFHKDTKCNFVIFLKGLVITDTAFLLCVLLINTPLSYAYYEPTRMWLRYRYTVYPKLRNPVDFVFQLTRFSNVWITVCSSIERYFSICDPFHVELVITKGRCHLVNLFIVLTAMALTIPHMFSCETTPCPTEIYDWLNNNITVPDKIDLIDDCYVSVATEFGKSTGYNLYRKSSKVLFNHVVPIVVLLLVNTRLVRELIRMHIRNTRRNTVVPSKMSSTYESELSISLLIIVLTFIVCQTPSAILEIEYDLIEENKTKNYFTFLTISGVLLVLNSSINCVIYLACGRQFRRNISNAFKRISLRSSQRSSIVSHPDTLPQDELFKLQRESESSSNTYFIQNMKHFSLTLISKKDKAELTKNRKNVRDTPV